MAAVLADYASLIQKVYRGQLAKTLLEKSPAYSRLQDLGKIRVDTRNELRWPAVSAGTGDADNIADGGTLPAAKSEEYDDAELNYKIFIKMVRVGRLVKMGSVNKDEFFSKAPDALQHQVNRAIPQMARTIHKQIIATTAPSANALVGLGDAVGNDSNTYAGIDRSTEAWWQPYVNDNPAGNRSLSEALMIDVFDTLTDDREAETSEIWCGVTAWNALVSILDTLMPGRRTSGEEIRAGVISQTWKGIPCIRMTGMDVNAMYFLDFQEGVDEDGIELLRQHNDDILVRPEATDSYDDRMSIAGHYQLVVHNPWKQGSLLDVN